MQYPCQIALCRFRTICQTKWGRIDDKLVKPMNKNVQFILLCAFWLVNIRKDLLSDRMNKSRNAFGLPAYTRYYLQFSIAAATLPAKPGICPVGMAQTDKRTPLARATAKIRSPVSLRHACSGLAHGIVKKKPAL